jgi:hypothetical protein
MTVSVPLRGLSQWKVRNFCVTDLICFVVSVPLRGLSQWKDAAAETNAKMWIEFQSPCGIKVSGKARG